MTVQDISQAGNIPIRIENLPSQHGTPSSERGVGGGSLNKILTVKEGESIELPCVGISLPPPVYR